MGAVRQDAFRTMQCPRANSYGDKEEPRDTRLGEPGQFSKSIGSYSHR
jgi:hypothetical protein